MHKSNVVSRLTFLLLALCCAAQAITAQVSASNYTAQADPAATAKPTLEAQTRAGQAPLSIAQKLSSETNLRVVRLNELSETEQQRTHDKKNFRIGIARPLPRQIESLGEFTAQATTGGTLYLLRIISPAAKSLRLHFKALKLPEGARLFVYSRQNNQIFSPPYSGTRADFWTPSLPGEEVIVECFVPTKATAESIAAPFQIDAVNHIFRAPRESQSATAQLENAGACNQEVPAEFSEAAKSTALIAFAKTDGEYVCSGTLMADIKKTGTPYFLTANHCISNSGEAGSAELYWFYDTGSEPTSAPTRGASLLVTDQADDYTLLQLSAKPPSGAVYSGWTSIPQAIGTSVTGIHHPRADHKRAAFGKIVEASCPAEIAPEFCDFFAKVRWDRGITEPGSSGSGIFIGTGNQTQLVGLLSGGESSCENPGGADFYGRMARIFGAFGYYLTNNEICRYTLLQDKFSYGVKGGNGEFTVVPKIGGENCPWQARSNVNWVTITSGASGTALGKVAFQVAAHTSDKPRAGAITIAGRNVLIFQAPTIAPTSPCAATKIEFGQTVTGDLRTATCSSLLDPTTTAIRYALDAEAGQSVSISFRQTPHSTQFRLIYPDGKVVPFRDSYPTLLPLAGTYIIELALPPSENPTPIPFNFSVWKGCKIKFANDYVEVDGFGQMLNPPTGNFARITTEITGENCFTPFAVADESGIDDGKLYAPYHPVEKAVILTVNIAEDPKQRYIVIRIMDQPIIVKQVPRCSAATTFAYTPSTINLPDRGGEFQMEMKRTAGPTCSWQVNPFEITETSDSPTREVQLLPENPNNMIRGTGDGLIHYKVPFNSSLRTKRYALKNNGQTGQSLTQRSIRATCAPTPLQVGQVITGQLSTSDCGWSEPGEYMDVYQLNALPGEQIAIDIESTNNSLLSADIAILDYYFLDSQGFVHYRWPDKGVNTITAPGTHLLFIYGKPKPYRVAMYGIGPAGCVYKVDKEGSTISLPADATSTSVQIECSRSDCDWTAQSSVDWVTFPNGASGKGSQMLTMALAPNTGAVRGATITVAGRTFRISQDYPCSFRQLSIHSSGKIIASYLGGEYGYSLTTGATCPALSAASNTDWIKATTTNRTVTLKMDANPGGFRKGTVKIDGKDYEVLQGGNDLVITTAADYQRTVAAGSLVTVFYQGMTTGTAAAQRTPLPYSLAGTSLFIRPSNGTIYIGSLLYASPTQINFFIPEHVPTGRTQIGLEVEAVRSGSNTSNYYAIGEFDIAAIAPNIFTADSTGKGPAAADIQRIRPGQPVAYEPVAATVLDEQGKPMIVARPIKIGDGDEKTYLVLYATGVRKRNANAAVTAQIGDVTVPVEYAGAQGQFVGLDQINILLPPSLRGKGLVNVTITMDGKTTNSVQINIAP